MASKWYNKFAGTLIYDDVLTEKELRNAIKNDGFDINEGDKEGFTLCMRAAEKGKTDTVRLLVKDLKADVNAKNFFGWTACMMAAERGYTNTVLVLKELGADVNARENDGRTALMMAAKEGHIGTVGILVEELDADIDAQDRFGRTACILAIAYGKTDTLLELVRLGADISIRAASGYTLFDYIDDETKEQVIKLRKEYEKNHKNAQKMADELAKIYLPEVAVKPVNTPQNGQKAREKGVAAGRREDRSNS